MLVGTSLITFVLQCDTGYPSRPGLTFENNGPTHNGLHILCVYALIWLQFAGVFVCLFSSFLGMILFYGIGFGGFCCFKCCLFFETFELIWKAS